MKNTFASAGVILTVAVIALVALTAHPTAVHLAPTASHATTPTPTTHTTLPTDPRTSAAALAAGLRLIDPTEVVPAYRRDEFGARWADVDGNGCDQRQDVLSRDLVDTVTDGCTVLSGLLWDEYTGEWVVFQHDRVAVDGNPGSQGVQIDHNVSLAAAYRGGAWQWTSEQRLLFANDFDNLLAVDGPTNQAKQDRGPADWLPPNEAFRCEYASRYVRVISTWDLAVPIADRDALVKVLSHCRA